MEFRDKVVIVTGAARGVGRATALEFCRQGASVVLVDILEEELKRVGEIIKKLGNPVLLCRGDVSNNNHVQDVVKSTLTNFKRIDVLVNNAGITGRTGPVIDLTEEDWDQHFQVNLKSIFLFCKTVVPIMMKNKKGNIVNVGSIAGKEGNENLSAYSASKAGVICFSRVLAKEVVKYGIRVNCIAPALIGTEMLSPVAPEIIENLLKKIPMGRMGVPEEVANLILFLASEKSSFITGQCINVTGGRGDY